MKHLLLRDWIDEQVGCYLNLLISFCLISTCIWTVGRWDVVVFCFCWRWTFGKRAWMCVPVRCGINGLRCTLNDVFTYFTWTKVAAKVTFMFFCLFLIVYMASWLVMFGFICYFLEFSGILNSKKKFRLLFEYWFINASPFLMKYIDWLIDILLWLLVRSY